MILNLSLRQKEIATGLVIIGLFVLGFGGGEVVLRAIQLSKFGVETSVEKSERFYVDPATGLRLPKPGTMHGKVRVNSLGFRSPEIDIPKPQGTIRLAFLGSSTTYDPYVSDGKPWPSRVTAALRQALPACRFDFVNAGVPGFTTDQMRTYFKAAVARTDPDLVIILPGDINLDADRIAVERAISDGVHYRPSWLARHSLLWAKIEKNLVIIRRQRSAHLQAGKLQIAPRAMSERYERRLAALLGAIQDRGAVPVLLAAQGQLRRDQSPREQLQAAATALFFMPYMSIGLLLDARDEYNRVAREVAHRTGTPFIGIDRLEIPGTATYYADTSHFTVAGSKLMARQVVAALLGNAQVRPILSRCAAAPAPAKASGS